MITQILLLFCTLVFLYRAYVYSIYRPKGFPPGPPKIPLFISYLFMMLSDFRYLHKAVLKFSKWYKSDIVGFHMGPFPVIAVHNPDAVREVLNSSKFEGRPQIFLASTRCPNFKISATSKMLTGILLGLCAAVCFYFSYRFAFGRPKGFPPGPPRIPLFGTYLFMMLTNFKYMHKAVWSFAKFYKTDIVGFHMGPFPVVAVHSAAGVQEILNSTVFDGRPDIFAARIRDPIRDLRGIFFQEGPIWKEQRRFILRYLRDFGFGRRFSVLELVIKEEISDFLDLIRNGPKYAHEEKICRKGGYRIRLPQAFNPSSVNSVFHIMFNERFTRADQADLIKLLDMGMQFQRAGDDYGKMLSIMPWIRHIFPNWSSYNKIMESNTYIYKFFSNIIDRYIQTYDPSAERNFVDLYITEMKKQLLDKQIETTTFSREQFIMSLIDFSFPAFTAVGVQISFLIQYFLLYPEVLKRVQAEIDDVVGSGRLPTLEDRKNLHYTEATIREGLRIEILVPSDVPHKATEDTELMGFKIPKETIVVPSLHAYHNDERLWGDPQNFRPERFLDEQGKLCLKKDVSLPFGAGQRLCAGETFARNMLFLLTTALCQNFNFVLGANDTLPDLSKTLSGLIISPPDFWLQLEERTSK